jgi:hypothetical protein
MSKEIIKNPGDLPIIENPNKTPRTMAKNKTDQAIDQFSQHAKTAAYILGGQAIAAQANAIAVPMALKNQSATIQQVARAGVPLALGVLLGIGTKNDHLRKLSLGFGTQGVLEGIKLLMPNFDPQQGFADSSGYVYTDETGQNRQPYVTADGQLMLPSGERVAMPAAKGSKPAKSTSLSEQEAEKELAGLDSDYTETDVEYV